MIKIGITGGIGSGKSVVSTLLAQEGIPVYKADDESKRLTDTSPVIHHALKALIDDSIFINDKLDRQRLADLIFNDEHLLKKVNEIIHPIVKQDFIKWVEEQTSYNYDKRSNDHPQFEGIGTNQALKCCALESAILFESHFDKEVDIVLMVFAPVDLRLKRVGLRDSALPAEILKRINSQLSDDIKREKADYVIINDDLQPLIPQVEQFVRLLGNRNR